MENEQFFRDARDDLNGPLHGVRVLDVTKVWSGPLATCVLADLGADVVRVELPDGRDGEVPPTIPGTGLSWFRQSVNRNKRSVGADLRTDEGRRTLLSLVRVADVLVENYRPGVLARWGVGYPQCRAVRPELVYVSVSGWGQYGPGVDRSAYDPVVQAAGGWMALNGPPDGQPVRAPTFLADELAGLHAAIAALGALAHRSRTGEGQHVDVAMLDSLLFSSSGLLSLAAAGAPPQRMGNQTDFVVPANVYHCRDGDIYLAVSLDRHWRRLTALMGHPELARDPTFATNRDRLAHRSLVDAVVAGWCATVTVAEAVAALAEAGLAVSAVRELCQVADDPQVRARQMLQRIRLHNGTEAELTGPAAKFSRTPTRIRRPAPAAGADTAEVLREWTADA
ncbi:CaiB/BaiF CoA transferase family protein [Micromonospora andamanensis]|uniref:CoA transferase n=1 Tax=Micromonospora andamanensis TaxID=1287068 RepID=A0ABQ4HTG3_9ACTN|nr:CoA transferase [Micromonospora andamanensis]GIJ08926.1 CoA transferase [Micromonospora andamanensis]